MPSTRNKIAAALAAATLAGAAAGAAAVALARGGSTDATTTASSSGSLPLSNASAGRLTIGQIAANDKSGVVQVIATQAGSASPYPYDQSSSQQAEGTGFVYDS